MGSGGHFTGLSRPVRESEDIFKTAVEEKKEVTREPPKIRNVFVSFHMDDAAQVSLLRSQARDEEFGMEFRDYSIKEPFDEQWKRNCADRIAQTSLTICMIGPHTAEREAVLWELEESYRRGRAVIGVRIYRDRDDPIPLPLKQHNAPIINWNRDEINGHLKRE